jgi:hypothetical protein
MMMTIADIGEPDKGTNQLFAANQSKMEATSDAALANNNWLSFCNWE